RRPYFPESGPLESARYEFRRPDLSDEKKIVIVSDTHSRVECPVTMGRYWGDALDFLIMNGDIPAESKQPSDIMSVLEVASGITEGKHPIVYVRGNHDTRGKYSLDFIDYIGNDAGNTYFTFRTGGIWGVVLDCGEDKNDGCTEYGDLVCCRPLRRRQTQFLKDVLENAQSEFAAPGVQRRIALCHIPFSIDRRQEPKFDIERDVYAESTQLLNRMDIDIMFCGHMHQNFAVTPDSPRNRFGANFPVVVSGKPFNKSEPGQAAPKGPTTGAVVTLGPDWARAVYRDSDGVDSGDERFAWRGHGASS
ncbi:MAG TPA: metallophosphoesterase, partial [Clostridia bacterium]|nr:metallophosphoesterase [Clostridia bacterium]